MTTEISPYLFFDGNAREAMEFYRTCLGGELSFMTYGDGWHECPAGQKHLIMHAMLRNGTMALMASDSMQGTPKRGDTINVCYSCESVDEVNRVYAALASGGKETMPLADMPWGRFGTVTDKYGMEWMFHAGPRR